jgi:hypothetical protein
MEKLIMKNREAHNEEGEEVEQDDVYEAEKSLLPLKLRVPSKAVDTSGPLSCTRE